MIKHQNYHFFMLSLLITAVFWRKLINQPQLSKGQPSVSRIF